MRACDERPSTQPNSGLYLGLDGGGTRTTAWVCDARGRVRGRGTAGPANPVTVGLAAAEREILDAAKRAIAAAGGKHLEAVCLGLAGADRPMVSGPLLRWLRKRLPAQFHLVTSDAEIALEAVGGREPGILIIAGTGSIAYARDLQGNLVRAGGWGATFDDAGSGFDLGRQAVHAALRAADERGAPTTLLKMIPRALGVSRIQEIIELGLTPAEIASLAPLVIRSADAGDAVARKILDEAGSELAELAVALIRRLGLQNRSACVVCAGGLLEGSAAMRRSLACHLHARAPRARLLRLQRHPVEGALALALRKGHRPTSRRATLAQGGASRPA
jgi:glucosamine kinase